METYTNSLSDNFVLKGFPAVKREQEVAKVFFVLGRRGKEGEGRDRQRRGELLEKGFIGNHPM